MKPNSKPAHAHGKPKLRSDVGYWPPTMQRLAVTKQQKTAFLRFFYGQPIALLFEHRYNATPF
jgi:hypothetical protein